MQQTANYGLKKPMGTDVVNIADLNDNADIIDQQLKENSYAVDTKETPAGAQAKANSAETKAKAYADSITPTKVSQLTNDKGYIAASGAPVQSVNGKTGTVSLTAANVGAAPAAHVNDTTKHITSAERSAWNAKPSSQRGVSDSVSSTSSSVAASSKAVKTAYDKGVSAYNLASTKEAAFSKKTAFNKNFGTTSGTVCQGNDSRLSNSRKCNNTFDNVSTARTNLGLTGTSNTTHYHDSRYVPTRVYNGKLQYYDGGWKNVGNPISLVPSNTLRFTDNREYRDEGPSSSGWCTESSSVDSEVHFKVMLPGKIRIKMLAGFCCKNTSKCRAYAYVLDANKEKASYGKEFVPTNVSYYNGVPDYRTVVIDNIPVNAGDRIYASVSGGGRKDYKSRAWLKNFQVLYDESDKSGMSL